jgi:hypothetical protein
VEKSYSQWTEADILEKLREIASDLGKFPTQSTLKKMGQHRLVNAISNLRLTYHDLATCLGHSPTRKPRGHWSEVAVIEELQQIKSRLQRIPSISQIRTGYGWLHRAIYKTRSWRYYANLLGEETKDSWTRQKIVEQLRIHADELGRTPTTSTIKAYNSKLAAACQKQARTLNDLLIEAGLKINFRDKGFWKSWDNFERVVRPLCVDGKMPPVVRLKETLGTSVGLAVADFGGVSEVADRLGVEVDPASYLTSKDGHLLDSQYEVEFDDFLFERGIEHTVHVLIVTDRKYKCDFKIGDVFVEIWGYNERPSNKVCARYAEKRAAKERLYRNHDLRVESIEGSIFRKTKTARRKHFDELLSRIRGCQR